MGLPRAKNTMPTPTLYGRPVEKNWYDLDPAFRKNALEELQFSEQMEDLADKQAQRERERQSNELEAAAIADLEAGADIGNVFRQRPGLALSRNFNQFANMAQMVQPSKAASTLAPSLARSLNPQSREKFLGLIQTPAFANDPLGAMTQVQMDEEREKQHGELVKAGIPLAKIDRNKMYSPIEFEEMVFQSKKPHTGDDYVDKLVQQAWSGFDENYIPPEGVDDPVQIAMDMAEKKNTIRQSILSKLGPKPAIGSEVAPQAGGVAPIPTPVAKVEMAPEVDLDAELVRIPVTEQAAFLENRKKVKDEESKVNEAWTTAKDDLEKKLASKFPDKPLPGSKLKPLEQLAIQIASGQLVTDPDGAPNAETGELPRIPLSNKALIDAGLPVFGKAFSQPGSGRTSLLGMVGSQDVPYNELIREWANEFVRKRNLVKMPMTERMDIPAEDLTKGQNLLNKYVPAGNR